MFKEHDRATQSEILRQLREVLRQLAEVRATVETLSVTQAHILSRLPRPDDDAKSRVEEIRDDMVSIRADIFEQMMDRLDDLIRKVK